MKRVNAQFRPSRRPSRGILAALAMLAACSVATTIGTAWQNHRLTELHAALRRLLEAGSLGPLPPAPHSPPLHAASARQFLQERGAAWAPMLRTLESGALIGVTPTSVEFDTADGSAHVELSYSDPVALSDYLGRVNEGVVPGQELMRWTLLQAHDQPGGTRRPAATAAQYLATPSIATIRSTWQGPTTVP